MRIVTMCHKCYKTVRYDTERNFDNCMKNKYFNCPHCKFTSKIERCLSFDDDEIHIQLEVPE